MNLRNNSTHLKHVRGLEESTKFFGSLHADGIASKVDSGEFGRVDTGDEGGNVSSCFKL
jgi:hypothetical protein